MSTSPGVRIVFCTAPVEEGPRLIRALLEARLIGGANVVSQVRSIYRWKGEIQDEPEVVMLIETSAERVDEAVAELARLHPYEVPKIVVFDGQANTPYVEWLRAVTSGPATGDGLA